MRFYQIFLLVMSNFIFLNAHAEALPYSINLMWINKAKNPQQELVAPTKDRNDANIQNALMEWAQRNPLAKEVNFWFDSQFSTDEQVTQTEALINRFNENRGGASEIKLKDLRAWLKEKYPEEEKEQYFSEDVPLYLRADLLRLMVSFKEVSECIGECASVYADVDVTPEGEDVLFSPTTMKGLLEYGIAFKAIDLEGKGFENSAHIVTNIRKNMLKALDEAVIQATFKKINSYLRVMKMLRENLARKQGMDEQAKEKIFQEIKSNNVRRFFSEAQVIYMSSLPIMILYYKFLEKDINGMAFKDTSEGDQIQIKPLSDVEDDKDSNVSILAPITTSSPGIFKFFQLTKNGEIINTFHYYYDLTLPVVHVKAPPIKYKYD